MFYEEIFKLLNKKRINYVVVGGVAFVLHGIVRLTADLDLMISLDRKNVTKYLEVMKEFGYKPKLPVKAEELMDRDKREIWLKERNMKVFSYYSPKQPLSLIDVFIYEPILFDELKANAVKIKSGNISIPVASADDLIKLKKISGRRQDMEDIKALKKILEK